MPLPALTKKLLPVASLACSRASNNSAATSLSFCSWTLHLLCLSSFDQPPAPPMLPLTISKRDHSLEEPKAPKEGWRREGQHPNQIQGVPVPMLNVQDSESCPSLFADLLFCVIKYLECFHALALLYLLTGNKVRTERATSVGHLKLYSIYQLCGQPLCLVLWPCSVLCSRILGME